MLAAPAFTSQSMLDNLQLFTNETLSNSKTITVSPRKRGDEVAAETCFVDCLPCIVTSSDNARLLRFQRVLKTCLQRHTLIVAVTTGMLLTVAKMLGATNVAAYTGLIGYLLGSALTATITFQGIRNATYADSKSSGER